MSRSPQNGGFHKCTGGSPFPPGVVLVASRAATVRPSILVVVCPCFAMVCLNVRLRQSGTIGARCGAGLTHHDRASSPGKYRFVRHIVMPLIPRNADRVWIV